MKSRQVVKERGKKKGTQALLACTSLLFPEKKEKRKRVHRVLHNFSSLYDRMAERGFLK